ncbi:MAG: transcription termination/antitermination protein NusA, partial [Desulfuromonadales bacterium]|nr:transcription termination/antitermination protein NusA [Desulfuromonadales bacterium]
DDQLSLAIGKKGQNVRLAAKLTNWKIDIKSETRAAEAELEEATAEAEAEAP